MVHHRRRADRRHRAVLAGAHPAGEDRREAPPSAEGRHPDAVPAVAGVRRAAVAARLAVGLHEAGRLPGRLRHRQARRVLPRAWRDARKPASSLRTKSQHLREELDAMAAKGALGPRAREARAKLAAARARRDGARCARAAQASGGAEPDGSTAPRDLLVLRLADLHQVQVAAVEHAMAGHRRHHPDRRR